VLKRAARTSTMCGLLLVSAFAALLAPPLHAADSTSAKKAAKQQDIREMSQKTLAQLYAANPGAKAVIEKSIGYAVFSNFGLKLLIAGSNNGTGIAVNNHTKSETFMKMIALQAGFGLGVKKFRVVFVFDSRSAFNNFVNSGWQLGGQSTLAAKNGSKGAAMAGAIAVSDGVWMYQLTESGLAAEITATGTKYFKDNSLN
jgi:lipid-binding SYLF domain-containing protein